MFRITSLHPDPTHLNVSRTKPRRSTSSLFDSIRLDHSQNIHESQRRLVEQLREEARRDRVKVSVVCRDLIRYISDHQANDPLVVGFTSAKTNYYQEKRTCSLF